MLITVVIATEPLDERATRYLRAVKQSAVELLHVHPDQVHLTDTDTDPATRARDERWVAIFAPQTMWSGC
ncbi:hypothetical protein [Nonomuraea jabiensis]|uniref:hypothetical protein n=1 Tax=Nonomuraea jabiensis TaxID=882448 RepID=UPI003D70B648